MENVLQQKNYDGECVIFCWEFTPEMEFLDINLTEDSNLFLHAIHSPFYWRILKKTIIFSGFKNLTKKSAKTRKLKYIHE